MNIDSPVKELVMRHRCELWQQLEKTNKNTSSVKVNSTVRHYFCYIIS